MEKWRGIKNEDEGDADDLWWWLIHKGITASFMCIAVFAFLMRVVVSPHPYSGANNPPKYGDYEAQRHWMEITLNLSTSGMYNCFSLGLTDGAVAAILSKRELIACIFFSLALNHKQMSAYFAPAFFSHLLGKCLRRPNSFLEVSKLGFVVLGTFIVVWWPYLHSSDAFFGFLLLTVYTNAKQWKLSKRPNLMDKEKKLI
ncbi:hypothetical protein L1049_002964 [Liquidambar formosana]|uniref:Alpha-1,3-glucosyltransferase n=1 Tax=Liquidambar formosana TaxID=63359 RepID=A0AAP0NGS0_LIQFO